MRAQLAALAALVRGAPGDVHRYLQSAQDDGEAFREFLAYHQLLAYAAHALDVAAADPGLPAALASLLRDHVRKLTVKNDRLRGMLPALADELARSGVPFLVLKGMHFAIAYYGGLERRSFWDLDLLIRTPDLDRADAVLRALGYARSSRAFISDRASRIFTHAYDYRHPDSVPIDLHWALVSHPAVKLREDEAWDSQQAVKLDGRYFPTLSESYALTFLLVGIVRDIERGALRLRSMVDLYLLLKAADVRQDWPLFFSDRQREGLDTLCRGVLALFFLLFDVDGGEFPRLQRALSRAPMPAISEAEAMALLHPGRYAIGNKRWASRLYESSSLAFLGWWALSLPARLVIHRSPRKPARKARRTGKRSS